MSAVDLFVSFTHLIVIVTTIGLFFGVLVHSVRKDRTSLPVGELVIVAGIITAAVGHISELVATTFFPDVGAEALLGTSLAARTWLHWSLSVIAFGLLSGGLLITLIARRRLDIAIQCKNALLDDLRSSQSVMDKRFRYLFESTTDSVYCYTFPDPIPLDASIEEHIARLPNAELQQANDVFVRDLEKDSINGVIGQRFGELDSVKDEQAHRQFVTAFVESGYRLKDYELNYKTPEGDDRALNVNLIGAIQDGRLVRFWGVESNVLEFRETKAELARRLRYQNVVARVSTLLGTASDAMADQIVENCMGTIARFFEADRSAMFWLDDRVEEKISIAYAWSRSGVDEFRGTVSLEMLPRMKAQLERREVIRIDSVAKLGADSEVDRANFAAFGLKSLLVIPLIVEDEIVGALTLGRLNIERPWSDQNVSDVTVFSELLANFVMHLKSRRALANALTGLQNATERLEAENVYLREEVERKQGFDEIVGESHAILRCLNQVEQVANTKISVLILGETGTGKELIARAIHDHSDRRNRPLVKINCAALPAALIESELFGHERGAFTGADSQKRGRFDLADGSTLFLDEIGEFPIELQAKLLRVLQEGEFERLGGTRTIEVDVRLVVATNRNLIAAVDAGEFRSDLYYRINTFPVELPALRDRGGDIELLARHFVSRHAKLLGRDVQEISSEAMRQLRQYDWPGNVRELDGIIQRALISNTGPIVDLAEPLLRADESGDMPVIVSSTIAELKLVEREHIVAILNESNWKISGRSGAASQLGIPPSTLRSKMKKLGIVRPN